MVTSRNGGVARILTRFYTTAFCLTGHNILMGRRVGRLSPVSINSTVVLSMKIWIRYNSTSYQQLSARN